MMGRVPGPPDPFASWASRMALLRPAAGWAQTAPPSLPRTRTIWSWDGAWRPAASKAAMSWLALSSAWLLDFAEFQTARPAMRRPTTTIAATM
jgi:hypothetical protein